MTERARFSPPWPDDLPGYADPYCAEFDIWLIAADLWPEAGGIVELRNRLAGALGLSRRTPKSWRETANSGPPLDARCHASVLWLAHRLASRPAGAAEKAAITARLAWRPPAD